MINKLTKEQEAIASLWSLRDELELLKKELSKRLDKIELSLMPEHGEWDCE